MKHLRFIYLLLITVTIFSCRKEDISVPLENTQNEDLSGYTEIASINLGGLGAAEISAFDPSTDKLFAVNNSYILNKIDVIDISNPAVISVNYINFIKYVAIIHCE